MTLEVDYNHARFDPSGEGGFYESYFQRANHPTRPLAFWIRYTLFVPFVPRRSAPLGFEPPGRPGEAIGELWAVWSDGERSRVVAAKSEIRDFAFARDRFHARVGSAVLEPGRLAGGAESRDHRIDWDLRYGGDQAPVWLLPPQLYAGGFPKAKSLVGLPMARYDGKLVVDGERHDIAGWIGSQNHNWGSRHTDRYAYGQVCGFDNAPESFLEVATGQLKIGPLWTPRMTPLVLRHEGCEYALRSVSQAVLKARGQFEFFHWRFASRAPGLAIEGEISAPKELFVKLRYYNPPGGDKWCFNSKLASCRLLLRRAGKPDHSLETRHRAAFEILSDAAA